MKQYRHLVYNFIKTLKLPFHAVSLLHDLHKSTSIFLACSDLLRTTAYHQDIHAWAYTVFKA